MPTVSPKGDYGPVIVYPTINLLSPEGRATLGKKYEDYTGSTLPTFEHLRQRGGLILYETRLSEADNLLTIKKPRDMIFVFVDGVSIFRSFIHTLDNYILQSYKKWTH